MRQSLKRIWAVARLTSMEGLRQPAFFFIFIIAAGLTALSPCFAFFHLGEEAKMVIDLGLSTILTFSTLLALLIASSTVTDEIEGRTALTMLSKPLRREEFLLGKFCGVTYSAASLALLMAPVLLTTLRSQQYESQQDPLFAIATLSSITLGLILYGIFLVIRLIFGRGPTLVPAFWMAYIAAAAFLLIFMAIVSKAGATWNWRILIGLFFICLHTWVISAVAVTLASRFTLVQSAIGTAAFFMVGHTASALVAPFRTNDQNLNLVGNVLRAILPDLDQFNITDTLAMGYMDKPIPIPFDIIAGSTIYALLYGLALLALAAALFSKRELG
ncbi:MAG: hypothetical protein V1899_09300 [Planctomycetota bacterium]